MKERKYNENEEFLRINKKEKKEGREEFCLKCGGRDIIEISK